MLGAVYLLLQFSAYPFLSANAHNNCAVNVNSTVEWIYQRLGSSKQISLLSDVCDLKRKVIRINPDKLFITNSRSQGEDVVCISDDVAYPCRIPVAKIVGSNDPRETLKKIFGYKEKIDLSLPIEESIERLLIRPAEIIYSEQEEASNNAVKSF